LKKAHTSAHGAYQPWQMKSGGGRFDFSWHKDIWTESVVQVEIMKGEEPSM
jgi:hypothetical protein